MNYPKRWLANHQLITVMYVYKQTLDFGKIYILIVIIALNYLPLGNIFIYIYIYQNVKTLSP